MDRMALSTCPEAHSRASTSVRTNSVSHSASGAVMVTSQASSTVDQPLRLEVLDRGTRIAFTAGHGAPAADHCALVAQADPASPHAEAMRMQDEIHGALRADRAVDGRVPAHEDLVVPDP